MKISIKILFYSLLFLILFIGCSTKKFPLVSNNELKRNIIGSLVALPYKNNKEQWYFHKNGNIYTPQTRDYPYKHLEGKYYIQDGRLITIGPKETESDYLMELDSKGKTYILNGVPINKQLSPLYHRFVKIDDNKYFWNNNGETDELISDNYFDTIKTEYGKERFKTKQDYINFRTWYIEKYTQVNDWDNVHPYDFNISTLSDRDINGSLIIINSQSLNKDQYLYAYNNKLYINNSIDNEVNILKGEIEQVAVSIQKSWTIIKDNGEETTEHNPYIGLYTIGNGTLLLKLPEKDIENNNLNNLWLRVKYFKKLSNGLYEGCVHKIRDVELSCSENKIYILKNPQRCTMGDRTYFCLNQNRLNQLENNSDAIYSYLSSNSNNFNKNLKENKKLTNLYRKILKNMIINFKSFSKKSEIGQLNAINSFLPLKILLDNDEDEFNKIINVEVLNYENARYKQSLSESSSKKYRAIHGYKIQSFDMHNIEDKRKNIRVRSIKNLSIAMDWLLDNGKVYFLDAPISENGYDILSDSFGNIHIHTNMITKHTQKELELLFMHEAIHSFEAIGKIVGEEQLLELKNLLSNNPIVSPFSNIFSNIGIINSIERNKSIRKVLDGLQEKRVDLSVLILLKSEKNRNLYCNLVKQYAGGIESRRYMSIDTLHEIIKQKYFSRLMNDMRLILTVEGMKNKKFYFSKAEKFLIKQDKYQKILKEQEEIFLTNSLSPYKRLYRKFIYFFFKDVIDAKFDTKLEILRKKQKIRIKEEDDKMKSQFKKY